MTTETSTRPRPVGVVHLVFGLIFSGIAALWFIGYAADADYPNLAKGIPVVLIGAGLVGLGASTVNHRRARARLQAPAEPPENPGTDTLEPPENPVTDTLEPPETPEASPITDTTPTTIIEKDQP